MSSAPLYVLAVLAASVALAERLERTRLGRQLGAALIVIVLGAVLANTGVLPRFHAEAVVYPAVFEHVAPLAIFWLLLRVHLAALVGVGPAMLALFGLAVLGTLLGVLAAIALLGLDAFGPKTFALGGMFAGTYIGGSINFNAIAIEHGVDREAALFAGANAVDAAMTTLWMLVCVALPRWLAPARTGADARAADLERARAAAHELDRPEPVRTLDVALLCALGLGATWAAPRAAAWLDGQLGLALPSMLVLTTIALVLAHVPWVRRLSGAHVLGLFAVEIFLAVVGVLCDVEAVRAIGALAPRLVLFVAIVMLVHGVVVFGGGRLARLDAAGAAVASQAAIGGGSSALALAKVLGRSDLVLPGVLLGALGTALGTYLGLAVAAWLAP